MRRRGPTAYKTCVHITLAGLRPDVAIRTVDVYPYGYGHYQYASPGLPANTPGLTPGAWRAALKQAMEVFSLNTAPDVFA